jgi:hypothetical protein
MFHGPDNQAEPPIRSDQRVFHFPKSPFIPSARPKTVLLSWVVAIVLSVGVWLGIGALVWWWVS